MNISVESYVKNFGKHTVLDRISLELESGKIYGFVGKNGSGKTMLMRAICGLILPTAGKVVIDGKTVGKDISFPENCGILIENPGFVSGYSGFRNLKHLASLQNRIDDEKIRETLREVGLDPNEKKSFRKYSLGMKQKLGIAAALMEDPNLILLDEPFNALDEETVDKVRELIRSKKREDTIIILSCHDKEEIENLCDEIVLLKNGKVMEVKKNEKMD